jgi:polyphosphate kinase 2 (PPK2 family)
MGRKPKNKRKGAERSSESTGAKVDPQSSPAPQDGAAVKHKMKRKQYEGEMRVLHGELVAMQEWVKATGAKAEVQPVEAFDLVSPVGQDARRAHDVDVGRS